MNENGVEPTITIKTPKTIVPMKEASIQRIVAGQAVTDLASAVKELVDNALDAGATTINIRLFNQGMDVIEVSDDGCGVPVESRPYMAQKHATSKITSFDDIYTGNNPGTLGFRGEALFCLANLSENLVIVTRTALDSLGQKMEFRRNGFLATDKGSMMPRKVGTTVAVVKLFDALPVRRADFCKRIQAQRTKVFSLMQGYAILCVGIKFNLIDYKDNKEEVKMRTSSSTNRVEQTVSSVLGSKFLAGMCRIQIDLTMAVNKNQHASVTGLISKAPSSTNNQAMARELQLFSINNRPVELPKVSRHLNELWRNLDSGQKKRPACVLQFSLPRSAFDVNLSPDKRDVMLTDQDAICDLIRDYVQQIWTSQSEGTFQKAQVELEGSAATSMEYPERRRQVQRRMAFVHDLNTTKFQLDEAHDAMPETKELTVPVPSTLLFREAPTDAERSRWTYTQQTFQSTDDTMSFLKTVVPPITPETNPHTGHVETRASKSKMTLHDFSFETITSNKKKSNEAHRGVVTNNYNNSVLKDRMQQDGVCPLAAKADIPSRLDQRRKEPLPDGESSIQSPPKFPRREERLNFPIPEPTPAVDTLQKKDKKTEESKTEREIPDEVTWTAFEGTDAVIKATKSARLKQHQARSKLKLLKTIRNESSQTNTSTNSDQDIELEQASNNNSQKLHLCKADFSEMLILGQFNLGFILCKSKQDHHLWILDQHACDEKYNFEALCRDTKLQEQRLIQPLPLELSPSEETCIVEHRDTFAANGFRFVYNSDKPPRHRFSLTTLPYSGARDGCKAVQFSKEDVSALCAVLGADGVSYSQDGGTGVDGTGLYGNNAVRRYASSSGLSQNACSVLARLPKAIAMFANRACRGSIMIGTALNQTEMETIVQRLKDVDQPWNCPHGRPTIRHIADLLPAFAQDHDRLEEQVAGPSFSVMTQISQSQDYDGRRL